jgi:indole-3-glycerol phosphate synthase
LEIVSGSVSAIDVTVCRLTASVETMKRRVKLRESGISQQEDVSRVAELNAIG